MAYAGYGFLGVMGTTLTYRMLIKTYANSINSTGPLENLSELNRVNLINNRMKRIRNFALLTAPAVIGGLMYFSHKFPSKLSLELFVGNKINENVASTSIPSSDTQVPFCDNNNIAKSLFFSSMNKFKFNWIKTIKWFLILIVILGLILKFIFNIDDNLILSLLLNLNTFIGKNIEVLKYLILIWMWGWFFIGIINYIKYKYFYEKTFKKIPKYLPKIFKEEIELFNESSQFPENKEILVAMSRKNLIYIFCFNSFFTCLFLYF